MAIKLAKNKWKCPYCEEIFPREADADMHRDTEHDIVYLALSREDLNHLLMFVFRKDDGLLTPSLIQTLQTYSRNSFKRSIED